MTEKKVIQCLMQTARHFILEMILLSRRKKQNWPKDWYVKLSNDFLEIRMKHFSFVHKYYTPLLH